MIYSFMPSTSRNEATNRSSMQSKFSSKNVVNRLYSPFPKLENVKKMFINKEMKVRSGKKKLKKFNRLDCTNRSLSARPSKGKKGRK